MFCFTFLHTFCDIWLRRSSWLPHVSAFGRRSISSLVASGSPTMHVRVLVLRENRFDLRGPPKGPRHPESHCFAATKPLPLPPSCVLSRESSGLRTNLGHKETRLFQKDITGGFMPGGHALFLARETDALKVSLVLYELILIPGGVFSSLSHDKIIKWSHRRSTHAQPSKF